MICCILTTNLNLKTLDRAGPRKDLSIWEKTAECGVGDGGSAGCIHTDQHFHLTMTVGILLISYCSYKAISEFLQDKMPQSALIFIHEVSIFHWWKQRDFWHTWLLSNSAGCFLLISLSSRSCKLFHNSFRACFFLSSTVRCAHFFFALNYVFYILFVLLQSPRILTCPPSFFKSN